MSQTSPKGHQKAISPRESCNLLVLASVCSIYAFFGRIFSLAAPQQQPQQQHNNSHKTTTSTAAAVIGAVAEAISASRCPFWLILGSKESPCQLRHFSAVVDFSTLPALVLL